MFALDFPDPNEAPKDEPLAVGGDLTELRLLSAYRQGIFPWYEEGSPIYWWCPDPRYVLFLDEYHINRGLRRELKKESWAVTMDKSFRSVITACSQVNRKGQEGTWITDDMVEAYCRLHELGHAHSVETWCDGELVGGLYGIAVGKVFCGESMFHHKANASKVAFAHLLRHLHQLGFELVDCQMPTKHLSSFGAREIPRSAFLNILNPDKGKEA